MALMDGKFELRSQWVGGLCDSRRQSNPARALSVHDLMDPNLTDAVRTAKRLHCFARFPAKINFHIP